MRYSPELDFSHGKHASVFYPTVKFVELLRWLIACQLGSVKRQVDSFREGTLSALEVMSKSKKIQADKTTWRETVLVKTTSSNDERHNTDLAHFLIHTGVKKIEIIDMY